MLPLDKHTRRNRWERKDINRNISLSLYLSTTSIYLSTFLILSALSLNNDINFISFQVYFISFHLCSFWFFLVTTINGRNKRHPHSRNPRRPRAYSQQQQQQQHEHVWGYRGSPIDRDLREPRSPLAPEAVAERRRSLCKTHCPQGNQNGFHQSRTLSTLLLLLPLSRVLLNPLVHFMGQSPTTTKRWGLGLKPPHGCL